MELGSEFNLNLHNLRKKPNTFYRYMGKTDYCLFDSGRSALKAVAGIPGSGYILMPEYICQSVLSCFPAERIIFYRLKKNLQIDLYDLSAKIDGETAAVYLMHYFGKPQPEDVLSFLLKEKIKYGFLIIEDTTHSIFSRKRTIGDYCVASLRKWFALPDGGVLYTGSGIRLASYENVPRNTDNDRAYAMILKTMYLNGRLDCNPEYRKMFKACEEELDAQENGKKISDFSEFLLDCNDVGDMAEKRKSNLKRLKNGLLDSGIKQLCDFGEQDCPFSLPVVVQDRDNFRGYLAENKIYCAVHWPFDGAAGEERPLAAGLARGMLSLPVDQRYGEAEMAYLLDVIGNYRGGLRL